MTDLEFARVGLYLSPDDPYANWYKEALDHFGLAYELIDIALLNQMGAVDVLVLAGAGTLKPDEVELVHRWIRQGGSLVVSPTTWGLDSVLGVMPRNESAQPSRELLVPALDDPTLWPEGAPASLFFGGTYIDRTDAEVLATTSNRAPAATERKWSNGAGYFLCAHLGQTMALMQSGRSIETPIVGPSDGSCHFDHRSMKAESGSQLDFWRDRLQTENTPNAYFNEPHADVIKEFWFRLILRAIDRSGKRAAIAWMWPQNAVGAACVSIECEEFNIAHVNAIYKMLVMMGAPATWLVGLPGYPQDVYRQLIKWGHDVGMLFITDDSAGWSEERMKIQHLALSRAASLSNMISARPVAGRWFRHQVFYDLCEVAGSRISLSKGGRQAGTSGFLFGTAHPFFPQKRDGSSYRVLEMPYLAFLPGVQTPDEIIEALLPRVVERHGCFHFGYTSTGIATAASANGLRRAVSLAKQQGLEVFTASTLYHFEKTRRNLRKKITTSEGKLYMQVIADQDLEGLTWLVGESALDVVVNGRRANTETVRRFGRIWTAVTLDLEAKTTCELSFERSEVQQAAA
ncbi:MAG TPA: hypothetical protein PLO61_04865 [Fimbriimonadaceae bacterium]|nr:hypothetical protein [Fimbriimonadaceae bacterium]HRJ32551.1 hypothetical protein [Fimbriimonadaceae bacterium]